MSRHITEILILEKSPLRESSLVVSGISPDDGKISFVAKGAANAESKNPSNIDLFKVLEIEVPDTSGNSMPTIYKSDELRSFCHLSEYPDSYLDACILARFALDNSSPDLPCPELYGAMTHVLSLLASPPDDKLITREQARLLVILAYLNENGLIPDSLHPDPARNQLQHRLLAALLEAAQGELPLPGLDHSYWINLERWAWQLCDYHGLKRPQNT